jgi:cyclase
MTVLLLFVLGLMNAPVSLAQQDVGVTEITPNVLVFATKSGNVVASVGNDGALLVGTPSAESTPQISRILAGRTKSPFRYVVIAPEPLSQSEADAGWGRKGAFVAMQEKALERLGGHAMGPSSPFPPRLRDLGVDRPPVSFSEVISFDMNGEAIHIIHQPPGYSDADSVVHFHVGNVIYLGEVFPGDGYPLLDRSLGGELDGLVNTLSTWTGDRFRILPARGSLTNGARVKAFRDMIVAVRDRVKRMIDAGQTEQQIVAAQPTKEFDAEWGHGRVSPEAFVHGVYAALTAPKAQ